MIFRMFVAITGLLISSSLLLNAAFAKRPVWFPLQDFNRWELVSPNGTNMISARDIGPKTTLQNLFGPNVRITQRGQNLFVRTGTRSSPLIIGKRGLNSPWTVRFSTDPCGLYEAQWVSTNATAITPAGLFRHCRILYLRQLFYDSCATPSLEMYLYLAPDIGPVQIDHYDNQLTLASARINGTNIARAFQAPPLSDALTLQIYGNMFTNRSYSGSCDVCDFPATMQFQLTFSNSLSQPLCIGQRVELEIVNSVGSVMKLWSEDPDFGYHYFPAVLAPGEIYIWNASAKLNDRRGWPLSGDFQAWASIQAYQLQSNAMECVLPSANNNPIIFGAQQNISVVMRYGYIGGVIITFPH